MRESEGAGVGGGAVSDELARLVRERYERGAAAWRGVALGEAQFTSAVIARMGNAEPRSALDAMVTDDLYLACGCAAGDPAALAAFERHCGPAIARGIATMGVSLDERADLEQVIRQRLLVSPGDGAAPRIATYGARGPLRAWVRVVAARETARMLSRERREVVVEDEQLAAMLSADDDPETGYLKRLYRDEFKQAFHAAIDALDDGARLVLRQYVLDGLSIDQLAALHSVHRATAARWVQGTRDRLLASTQRELLRRLHLSRSELVSVLRLIHSGIEVSLARVLRIHERGRKTSNHRLGSIE